MDGGYADADADADADAETGPSAPAGDGSREIGPTRSTPQYPVAATPHTCGLRSAGTFPY
ncbi:MAG: hypothetical protein ACYCV4_10805 [Dermatophilaceae bacterium]